MKQYIFIVLFFYFWVGYAQQTEYVDFIHADVNVSFDYKNKEVIGEVVYKYQILKKIDSIEIDAANFSFIDVDNEDFKYDGKKIMISNKFWKEDSIYSIKINWKTKPKKALYFVGWDDEAPNQIWTQGQGKYTSNWLPSFDDVNEKVEFDISIVFKEGYSVVSNGEMEGIERLAHSDQYVWKYSMKNPMSSYLVALVIGDYNKKTESSRSGVPLEMYYYPEDSLRVESTYRYTKQMFDFLEEEIGVSYPWQNYKQVPVHDFLYAGMENTTCTIFSDAYMVDEIAFIDKNYVNVNAHELAHQWFGDLVTAESGDHHWLQEGFATYYALLAEKDVFGDDYFYWRLYEYAEELKLQDDAGKGTSLLNPKSSSTTFYKKGAFALYMLREFVGDLVFKNAVKNYLIKHQYNNVSTKDFLIEVEALTGEDLGPYVDDWLESDAFPFDGVLDHLKHKSMLISSYLIIDCEAMSSKCLDYLSSDFSYQVQSKVISQINDNIPHEAFETSDIKVRQALATNVVKIPQELKTDYESLLLDKSYVTVEVALYNLWSNFQSDRSRYLDQTEHISGFNNRNVRILWLALAMMTKDYRSNDKMVFYNELLDYTSSRYNFEVRQNAFEYLRMMNSCNDVCKDNLKQAVKHHNWRMSKYAKKLLNDLKE